MKLSDVIVKIAEYISDNGNEELPDDFHLYLERGSIMWY